LAGLLFGQLLFAADAGTASVVGELKRLSGAVDHIDFVLIRIAPRRESIKAPL